MRTCGYWGRWRIVASAYSCDTSGVARSKSWPALSNRRQEQRSGERPLRRTYVFVRRVASESLGSIAYALHCVGIAHAPSSWLIYLPLTGLAKTRRELLVRRWQKGQRSSQEDCSTETHHHGASGSPCKHTSLHTPNPSWGLEILLLGL